MSEHEDPILDELWGNDALEDGDVTYDGPFGVGRWPDAILMEVDPIEDASFGRRVKCVFNLKGEEGYPYHGRIDLPRTIDVDGDADLAIRANKANEFTRNTLATVLHSAGVLPAGKKPSNVDTDDQYERILAVFRHAIGRKVPIEVKVQRRKNKSTGLYEDTNFTSFQGLRPKKA